MLLLSVLDDAALRREFETFAAPAGGTDDKGVKGLGKQGLAQLMSAQGLVHGDAAEREREREVARVLTRVDVNEDGERLLTSLTRTR